MIEESAERQVLSDGPAIRLQAAAEHARRLQRGSRAQLLRLEGDLDLLADDLSPRARETNSRTLIGFDRPANVYLVSSVDRFTSAWAVLRSLIRARPWERHIVLLTGGGDIAAAEEAVRLAGGFAISPDPSLGLFDRWLWLAGKLDAYAAQRVLLMAEHPDIVARLGARHVAGRYGDRLYVVHSDDRQPCAPDATLSGATHLVLAPALRHALKSFADKLRVGTLTVPFEIERPESSGALPPPPIRGPGRRAALRWYRDRTLWLASTSRARLRRAVSDGPWAEALWKARLRLARARPRRPAGEVVTASAGREADFDADGPLAFSRVIAEVLRATGGRHLHIGSVSSDFRRRAVETLHASGIDSNLLVFKGGDLPLVSAFVAQRIDLLIDSFPRSDPGVVAAAAWTGLPLARHTMSKTEARLGDLNWSTVEEIGTALAVAIGGGDAGGTPRRHAKTGHRGDTARLERRFTRIIDRVEGRLNQVPAPARRREIVAELFDADHYRQQHPGVAAEGDAALVHYLESGAAKGSSPCLLFDPEHYLNSLPSDARKAAAADPLAHYLTVGERRGHPPHPLFDPVVCAASPDGTAWHKRNTDPAISPPSVLATYLSDGRAVRPHTFFDPSHYLRQLDTPLAGCAPLVDFLRHGVARGLDPHPLVELHFLSPDSTADYASDLIAWLRGELPAMRQPCLLLDNAILTARDPRDRLASAAPNLLWAHVIEGNLTRRPPHLLISPARVEEMRPGALTDPCTVLEMIARDRLGNADPHALVCTSHILAQAPWLAQVERHPLRHFLERGAIDNIDPHPWFSTQFYLYRNPDVARARKNPLLHYLAHGAVEGRWPSAFFNGIQYFKRYLAGKGGGNPLVDYVTRGAGLFWTAVAQDDSLRRVSLQSTKAHFALEARIDQMTAGGDDGPSVASGAASLLRQVMHHPQGADHPTLLTETRSFRTTTPEPGPDLLSRHAMAPAVRVTVARPSIVSPRHIAAASGNYTAPAIDVGVYPDATLVAGNDGFLTATGTWLDHGLAGFDPAAMEPKGNAAVFALAGDRVLLRRHRAETGFAAGIFCCGSYSRNYYHFLIETLPRALFAAEIAPRGTPILTDNDMPDQHYQALRLMMPDNPIIRLERHRSYPVERLYAASQPNVFHDAFLKAQVPLDAIRVHPETLGRFAALASRLHPRDADGPGESQVPRRLFLARHSRWRQLLNAATLQKELVERGFSAVDFGTMSFAEQIRHMAQAEAVVGQSSAQFANTVFARPGTRIFPLFSNAAGTNFNLWQTLAAPLGVETINVVGWRVPGSTGGEAPEAHEHFSVPPQHVTAFFPRPLPRDDAKSLLDALLAAGGNADALTGAWALFAQPTPPGHDERLRDLRRRAVLAIENAADEALPALVSHPLFSDPWTTLKSGLRAQTGYDDAEARVIARIERDFAALAAGQGTLAATDAQRLILGTQLLLPAWRLPMIAQPEALPEDVLASYLHWLTIPPFLFREGDDQAYVDFCVRLLNWTADQLAPDRPDRLRRAVARMAGELDLNQLFLIEAPVTEIFAARNRVLDRIAIQDGRPRAEARPADGSQGRRRIGVLFRTFEKGPDSEAVVAMFRAFDRSRFEIFGYSIGFQDRVVTSDSDFDVELSAAIEHRRLVSADPVDLRRQLLDDDLDVFVYANATTYGIKAMERALYHRVAPLQVVTNSHLPLPFGFTSFDAYLTGISDHAEFEVAQDDCPEQLVRLPGPVISYLTSLQPRLQPPLGRAELGLSPDDLVLMNAGSLQKLRRETLVTMLEAVRDVPSGVLLLAPFNPGWAGRSQAFAFNLQLRETAAEVGVDPSRLRILSEMTVAETEAALSCADIYLNPFPHGGATMTHLALIYGIPPVTMRRRSTRSIDQFLISSLGFSELLTDTPQRYVALVKELATDPVRRVGLSEAIRRAARTPPFVDNPAYSRDIQDALSRLLSSRQPANGVEAKPR